MIKLDVQDANRNIYQKDFDVENQDGFPILICEDCGCEVNRSCGNGHLAYAIIDNDVISKTNDAIN